MKTRLSNLPPAMVRALWDRAATACECRDGCPWHPISRCSRPLAPDGAREWMIRKRLGVDETRTRRERYEVVCSACAAAAENRQGGSQVLLTVP